ncbi:DNA-directed RNA polymerase subunit K [Candidatus Pacearchaeota archaeon]|nr:DNA-directed RNA polymerase subunit K [Candidatus Pacearchaeota archaeon]|tara:strand:- start:190 stop:576 length:387 start_codon:yes stop_codon:yes gene_type:complete
MEQQESFTKYEIARIIGARALQIAMDAPHLLKLSEDELKDLDFDALKIAEKEFDENVLPIAIQRPTPKRGEDKLKKIKEDTVSDEELIEKEKELEKEIVEDAHEMGLVNPAEAEESTDTAETTSEEEQ